jgi:hypothetical protein
MTEPTNRDPVLDDAPTTPTQQEPSAFASATPPAAPQQATPPAWQPAGWSKSGPPDAHAPSSLSWTPAGQAAEAPPRSSRGRWLVALLAAAVVLVGAIGVAVFALGSKSTASIGPSFMPASTAVYLEARLDLPGSQRDAIVKLASHFPGFADQAAFDLKVDETLDKYVGQAAGGAVSYSRDIKPWFSGQVALGVLELPVAMSGSGAAPDTTALQSPHVLAGIGVKDRAKLESLLVTVRAVAGGTFTEEQYGDTTIVTVTSGGNVPAAAYAVTDTILLVAPSSTDLKKGLDVLAGNAPALAKDTNFSAAMKDLPQDRLGAFYVSPAVAQTASGSLFGLGGMPMGPTGTPDALKCIQPAIPDPATLSSSGAIVAAGDHIAIEIRANNAGVQPARQVTDLAAHHPADATLYLEVPKVGGSIHDIVACLRTAMPDMFASPQLTQIEKLLGTKVEDYGSFITDVGISASFDGKKFHWGLVAGVDNDDTAKTRVTALLGYLKLGSTLGGLPVTVTEAPVNGVTVTTITLNDVPQTASLPIDQSISVAVNAGHLYIGGGDFASTAMTRAAADSLASNQRFSTAVTAAGSPTGVTLYVDLAAARQLIEGFTLASPLPDSYVVDTQPYLKPFDRLIIGSSGGGDTTTGRILVFVK